MDTIMALKITATIMIAILFECGWFQSVKWMTEWNFVYGMIWLLVTGAIQLFVVLRFTEDFIDLF